MNTGVPRSGDVLPGIDWLHRRDGRSEPGQHMPLSLARACSAWLSYVSRAGVTAASMDGNPEPEGEMSESEVAEDGKACAVQGYLACKKRPTPLGPP